MFFIVQIELQKKTERTGMWETFPLTPVISNYIKFTVTSVWTRGNNGYVEIEIYGTPGMSMLHLRDLKGYGLQPALQLKNTHILKHPWL